MVTPSSAIEPATVITDSESHSQRTFMKVWVSSSDPRDGVELVPLIMLYVIPVTMLQRVWVMFGPARYALFQKYGTPLEPSPEYQIVDRVSSMAVWSIGLISDVSFLRKSGSVAVSKREQLTPSGPWLANVGTFPSNDDRRLRCGAVH